MLTNHTSSYILTADRKVSLNISHMHHMLTSNTGTPAMSSSAEVFVTILNINDNGPLFGQHSYSVSLKDNATIGTTVLQLNASDADSPALMFSILSGNTDNAFSISEPSGRCLV